MMILNLVALILGALLGLRYRIIVLLSASAICLALSVADSMAHGSGFWASVIAVALSLTSLQFGYLVGNMLVLFTAPMRTRSLNGGSRIAPMRRIVL